MVSLSLIPFMGGALAADITITADGTYTITSTDTSITIAAGLAVTLIGSSAVTYDLPVVCGEGVSLTLQDVHLSLSSGCALRFTGVGNQLYLTGDNSLQSGPYDAGIYVGYWDALTIGGDGSVEVTGGGYGAGIGGSQYVVGGTITITSGTVAATGGDSAAGIGGGANRSGSVVTISGGTVTAFGGNYAAGIGGGFASDGGEISISGGTVTATGGSSGAGIGGGLYGGGGTISVSGGTVIATGGAGAAGIGGGFYGSGGAVDLSGGAVYAQGDFSYGAHDIGPGYGSSEGTLAISDTAAVFLRNDYCLPPTLPVPYSHKTPADAAAPMIVSNGTIYGIAGTGVSPWTAASGGYFVLYTLAYDTNGGVGSIADTIQHQSTQAAVKTSVGISRSGYTFSSWNTAANGSGTAYAAGSNLTFDIPTRTLYAQWRLAVMPQTGDAEAPYLYLYAALALLSLAGIAFAIRKQTKRQS